MASGKRTVQFSVTDSIQQRCLVPSTETTLETRLHEVKALHERMADVDPDWPLGWDKRTSPCQTYVPLEQIQGLEKVHNALNKSVVSIVDRWFSDEANFAARMPVQPAEEQILKWMSGAGSSLVPSYKCHQGNWRPDFLFEAVPLSDGTAGERLVICEINSRLPYNGYVMTPNYAKVFDSYDLARVNLRVAVEKELSKNLFRMFDTTKPIHAIQDSIHGELTHFGKAYTALFGQVFRVVKPSDFRLVPDTNSPLRYSLWCVGGDGSVSANVKELNGEIIEPVHQVTANLYQHEYAGWSFEMMCLVAAKCVVNDLRSVFLANDQRLLGIVLEELDNLVSVEKVITNEEANLLQRQIVPTFIPSSPTWKAVLNECELDTTYKDSWMIKPSRSGMGRGHVFGASIGNEAWLRKLRHVAAAQDVEEASFCLQKVVRQTEFDIIRHDIEVVEKLHLVGTYLCVQGDFQGLGPVRVARDVCIPISHTTEGIVMAAFTDTSPEENRLDSSHLK